MAAILELQMAVDEVDKVAMVAAQMAETTEVVLWADVQVVMAWLVAGAAPEMAAAAAALEVTQEQPFSLMAGVPQSHLPP